MMRAATAAFLCLCVGYTARATESPVFDIPRLDGVVVDGVGDDWGEGGFQIRILTTVDGAVRPIADLDAQARLAWDATGLLVLVDVTDDTPDESENEDALWEGDGIELFAAAERGKAPHYQTVVSPGADPAHPELRRTLHARKGVDVEALAVETAAVATEGGYAIEARLPWANLTIDPREGLETGFQLYVNDRDGQGPTFGLAWYPSRQAHADASAMQRVRLSDAPSSPVTAAAAAKYDDLRRIVVQARW